MKAAAPLILTLLLATQGWAMRERIIMYAPDSDPQAMMADIDANGPQALYRSLDSCRRSPYPCRLRPPDGAVLWQGQPDENGECNPPLVYMFSRFPRDTGWEFVQGIPYCVMIYRDYDTHRQTDLTMAPAYGLPVEPVTITLPWTLQLTFPDPDTQGPGWFYQPNISRGYKIGRRRWVKAKTVKFSNGDVVTKECAGLDIEEQYPVGFSLSIVNIIGYLGWARVNPAYPWWHVVANQPLPNNPTMPQGPYTESMSYAATFQNFNNNASHSFLAQVKVGPRLAQTGGCQSAGRFPLDTYVKCEHRWSVLYGPLPL